MLSSIGKLGELSHLRGSLQIQKVKHVVDYKDATKASFMYKKNLGKLILDWGDIDNSHHEIL